MHTARIGFLALTLLGSALNAAELHLKSPTTHQVIQRNTPTSGTFSISGSSDDPFASVQARLVVANKARAWQTLTATIKGGTFQALFEDAPAGGWYQLDVRIMKEGQEVARRSVDKMGIGEVFVVAGQSNSANHGEEKLATETGRAATQTSSGWQICEDPQPGASGRRELSPATGRCPGAIF